VSLFGVRVNGVPKFFGGTTPIQSQGGFAVPSSGGAHEVYNVGSPGTTDFEKGVVRWNANVLEVGEEIGGAGSARTFRLKAPTAGPINFRVGAADIWTLNVSGHVTPLSSSTFDIGSSALTIRDIHVGRFVNFQPAASTFAQTATITNGPRAANPIAWVEVQVNGSSGRIPVW